MIRSVRLLLGLALVWLAAAAPAWSVCQTTGKSCGFNAPANDRLCCPGTVCGWGNVCQPACRINGVLYQNGAKNPANQCQSCQPSVSTSRWTPLRDGTACNDGNACTAPDVCSAGACGGSAVSCDDLDICTDDTCNKASGCASTPVDCDDHDRCTSDVCIPVIGCQHLPVDCDDYTACTLDSCDPTTGACLSVSIVCDDNNPCTIDSCDPATGKCVFSPDCSGVASCAFSSCTVTAPKP